MQLNFTDPSYLFFCFLALSAVVLAGVTIAFFKRVPGASIKAGTMWVAYCPWLLMAPLVLLTIGLGREAIIIALFFISLFCSKEFAKATGLYRDWSFMAVLYFGIASIYVAVWIDWFALFNALPIYAVILLFLLPIMRNCYQGMLQKTALSAVAVIYFGWFLAHLAFMENFSHGIAYILYVVFGTELNDIAAFISGKIFGKHHLFSNISPKKTIEGSLGALLVVSFYTWLASPWLPGLDASLLIVGTLVIWLGGSLGDLVISFIKRDVGIKDMGTLIPGHGGLLDRVDSLIFVAPLYFHLLKSQIALPGEFP